MVNILYPPFRGRLERGHHGHQAANQRRERSKFNRRSVPYPLSNGTVCAVGVPKYRKQPLRFSLKWGAFVSHVLE
jgi:hypothetical protein